MYDKFFPENKSADTFNQQVAECKAICNTCIHKKECYDNALTIPLNWGVWGGQLIARESAPINTKGWSGK
jgi:hypothetical protein